MSSTVKLAIIPAALVVTVLLIVVFLVPDFTTFKASSDGNFIIEREGSQETTPIPPNADIFPKTAIREVGEPISFSAGGSIDPDGVIEKHEWDFGDGSEQVVGKSITYAYNVKGEYQVTLTVIDNDMQKDSTTSMVIVEQKSSLIPLEQIPPTAKISAPHSGKIDEEIVFSAKDSEDPDGVIIKYEWSFNDSNQKKFGKEISHVFESDGDYNVILKITDNDNLTSSVPVTITIKETRVPEVIPNPQLVLTNTEEYEVRGNQFVRYSMTIENWEKYSPELFKPSPHLEPCGKNENAARTWVDIYNAQTSTRLYGFCALGSSNDLTKIWFAIAKDTVPPESVYIELNDREESKIYRSNPISILK